MLALLAAQLAATPGALRVTTYGNTALAGEPVSNHTVQSLSDLALPAFHSAVVVGQLSPTSGGAVEQWGLFSLQAPTGFARLWIDDHLMIDADLTGSAPPRLPPTGPPAPPLPERRRRVQGGSARKGG